MVFLGSSCDCPSLLPPVENHCCVSARPFIGDYRHSCNSHLFLHPRQEAECVLWDIKSFVSVGSSLSLWSWSVLMNSRAKLSEMWHQRAEATEMKSNTGNVCLINFYESKAHCRGMTYLCILLIIFLKVTYIFCYIPVASALCFVTNVYLGKCSLSLQFLEQYNM